MHHQDGFLRHQALAATILAAVTLAGICSIPANAAERLLVSTNSTLREYTLDGQLLSTTSTPAIGDGSARDIVQLWGEDVGVYNGTFSVSLSMLHAGGWTSIAVPGLSTVNNGTYGGIAYRAGFVYLTDMATGGSPEQILSGIVRIDLATGTHRRFLDTGEYIDITLGLDGKLYGLLNDYGDLDVIDPGTMTILAELDLGHLSSSRAVAVDVDGSIYMASWAGYIAKFTPAGIEVKRLDTDRQMFDIDIHPNGRIVATDWDRKVYLTDVNLNSATTFQIDNPDTYDGAFVAFFEPTPHAVSVSYSSMTSRLSWTGGGPMVDVYQHGVLRYRGANNGSFSEPMLPPIARRARPYVVCNTGSNACSQPASLPAIPLVPALRSTLR